MSINIFERSGQVSFQSCDLSLFLMLKNLIPPELWLDIEDLHIFKYTKDGAFLHTPGFGNFPFVGFQIFIEGRNGKKYRMYLIFEGNPNNLRSPSGWAVCNKTEFEEIEEIGSSINYFPFDSLYKQ